MNNWKKILSLLIAVCMIAMLLAACGSTAASDDTASEEPAAEETAAEEEPAAETEETEEPAAEEETEEPASEETEESEITEIKMAVLDMKGDNSLYDTKIEDAINAITGPAIGVNVDLEYYDYGNYATQISLAISGGEVLDLVNIVPLSGISFTDLFSNGELMDISEYLSQDYAADLMSVVGDYIGGYTVNGGIYAVPTYRIYSSDNYVVMRKDILDELGMTDIAENLQTRSDLETIYDAVLEGTDLYPIGGTKRIESLTSYRSFQNENFSDAISWDNLGDTTYIVMTNNDDLTVTNGLLDSSFQDMCRYFATWSEKGYIWPDTITNEDTGDSIIKQGVIFSDIDLSEYGVETAKKETTGYDVVCARICSGQITSRNVIGFGMGVPVTAEEPEAAVRFLNMLYNDADLMNIITWGIEGEDYVVLDSGEIDYPDGVDASTVEYHNADYLLGNQFLDLPWAGNGADFREKALEVNSTADISQYMSFSLDTSELGDYIAGISSVVDEYTPNLVSGFYTDDMYQAFSEKLEAAGAQEYIDAIQAQVDAWAANQ